MDTVFIVRDKEDRGIKGVYALQESAEDAVRDMLSDYGGPEDMSEEDMELLGENYEILEMPLE